MMRLQFTAADLRNITLMTPAALEGVTSSVRLLRTGLARGQGKRPGVVQWHREHRATAAARAGILHDLVPRQGNFPDFLLHLSDDLGSSVALAALTPADQLAADIEQLPASAGTQRRLRALADGAPSARQNLARDLHRYFDTCLSDWWPKIQAQAAADRALRAETLLRGGTDGLLATLGSCWRWEAPTLHIPWAGSSDIEVPLCGRGLVLVPSYFGGPALMYRPKASTVLVYPMHAGEPAIGSADALGPLLGRTRAAVLAATRHPANTTTIAERVGVSLPSASQHAAVLRNAGLITTTRTGSAVLHTLSPLGQALLRGDSTRR
ncbi:winged helix-turn-helix domain-containing protein [Streptomyces sp. PA03-1a]|nr:winged helix-turn-helix domain-containing protein [Streptomyces sp. PA03-1a]MDX2818814.1 winged helix-turn-helix domain-containing protein [Streptomyces sp. PA03-5A]